MLKMSKASRATFMCFSLDIECCGSWIEARGAMRLCKFFGKESRKSISIPVGLSNVKHKVVIPTQIVFRQLKAYMIRDGSTETQDSFSVTLEPEEPPVPTSSDTFSMWARYPLQSLQNSFETARQAILSRSGKRPMIRVVTSSSRINILQKGLSKKGVLHLFLTKQHKCCRLLFQSWDCFWSCKTELEKWWRWQT